MTKKRYNIWMDEDLIRRVKRVAGSMGLKTATYMRMAILEKLEKHQDVQEQNVIWSRKMEDTAS